MFSHRLIPSMRFTSSKMHSYSHMCFEWVQNVTANFVFNMNEYILIPVSKKKYVAALILPIASNFDNRGFFSSLFYPPVSCSRRPLYIRANGKRCMYLCIRTKYSPKHMIIKLSFFIVCNMNVFSHFLNGSEQKWPN